MKKVLLAILACSVFALPGARAAAPASGWEAEVRKFDADYWAAYNRCDISALDAMNSDDLEFYHDLGGAMMGRKKFAQAMEKNICPNPARRLRREAIAETVKFYPLKSENKVYGVVVEGDHLFYVAEQGKPEVLDGRARFTQLILLKNGQWKLARALSYAHGLAQAKAPEVQAAAGELERLSGQYTVPNQGVLTVTFSGNHLLVDAGGRTFELYPTSENNFAMEDRPMTASFAVDAQGRGEAMTVREHGAVMMEAKASAR